MRALALPFSMMYARIFAKPRSTDTGDTHNASLPGELERW
jgi:hypothetical protein